MAAHALAPGGEFIDSDGIPWRFLCPITHELFTDPVRTCATSHQRAFERSAIADWLQHHNVDPVSREVLRNKTLTPDVELRREVEAFRAVLEHSPRGDPPGQLSGGAPPAAAVPPPPLDRSSQSVRGGDTCGRVSALAANEARRDIALGGNQHVSIDCPPVAPPPERVFVPSYPRWERLGEAPVIDEPGQYWRPAWPCGRTVLCVFILTLLGACGALLVGGIACDNVHRRKHSGPGFAAGAAVGAAGGAIVFFATEAVTAALAESYPSRCRDPCGVLLWAIGWNWLRLTSAVLLGTVVLPGLKVSPAKVAVDASILPIFVLPYMLPAGLCIFIIVSICLGFGWQV